MESYVNWHFVHVRVCLCLCACRQPLNAGSAQKREGGGDPREVCGGEEERWGARQPVTSTCQTFHPRHSSVIYPSSPSIPLPSFLPPRTVGRGKAARRLRGGVARRGAPSITAEAETVGEECVDFTHDLPELPSHRVAIVTPAERAHTHLHTHTHSHKHKPSLTQHHAQTKQNSKQRRAL